MKRDNDVAISTEARLSFQRAFGIDPAMQMAIEGFYDSVMGPLGKIRTSKWPIDLRKEFVLGREWFGDDAGALPL